MPTRSVCDGDNVLAGQQDNHPEQRCASSANLSLLPVSASMDGARSLALFIFVSYFLVIISLFVLILNSIHGLSSSNYRQKSRWTFTGLALASLAHTWLRKSMFSWKSFMYLYTLSRYVQVPRCRFIHMPCPSDGRHLRAIQYLSSGASPHMKLPYHLV